MALIAYIDDDQNILDTAEQIGARVYRILRACRDAMHSSAYATIASEREKDDFLRLIIVSLDEPREEYLDLASHARTTAADCWIPFPETSKPLIGFTSFDAFLGHFESQPAVPSLVLQDLHLSRSGPAEGIATLHAVRARFPGVPIVVFSQPASASTISACLRAGANEFHFKGGTYFERSLIRILSHWFRNPTMQWNL
jgi:CheY-like chemotaxis protein